MAKAGFAGSLVVDANWKGRNLNRGMRDSRKRVNNFGKSIRRMVGAVALGAGAYVGAKGLIGLLKMSKAGSEAWSKWLITWESLKSALAKLVAGPAAAMLDWASELGSQFASYLMQFETFGELFGDIKNRFLSWSLDTWIQPFIKSTLYVMGLWNDLIALISKGVALITGSTPGAGGSQPRSPMLYAGANQLANAPSVQPGQLGTGF